jgi:hypothetical protein
MGKLLDDLFTFLFDDLFRILTKLLLLVMDFVGMDASTFGMIVLGIVAVWGVYWVAQQFLDH